MIRLVKGQANDIVVTLTEKGSASHYLFEFFSSATHVYHYCVDQDSSSHPERYNKFSITETISPTATNGEVELDEGEYRYVVYANSSSSNIDPSGLVELEYGMCTVTAPSSAIPSYDIIETTAAYEG